MGNTTSGQGSPSPGAETKAFAGVVLFGKSPEDLKVLEWACKHLHPSAEFRLCIIHVTELNDTNPPREHSRYEPKGLEGKFTEYYPDRDFEEFQNLICPDNKEYMYIWGVEYKGENFERTLQEAINNLRTEGLHTLVLRWSEPDDPQRTPVNRLESKGCSIVLANVDSSTRNNVLNLTTPPMVVASSPERSAPTPAAAASSTKGSSPSPTPVATPAPPTALKEVPAPTPAAPAKEGAAAPKNTHPNKTDATPSKASTGHPDRETDYNPRDELVASNSRSRKNKNKK